MKPDIFLPFGNPEDQQILQKIQQGIYRLSSHIHHPNLQQVCYGMIFLKPDQPLAHHKLYYLDIRPNATKDIPNELTLVCMYPNAWSMLHESVYDTILFQIVKICKISGDLCQESEDRGAQFDYCLANYMKELSHVYVSPLVIRLPYNQQDFASALEYPLAVDEIIVDNNNE